LQCCNSGLYNFDPTQFSLLTAELCIGSDALYCLLIVVGDSSMKVRLLAGVSALALTFGWNSANAAEPAVEVPAAQDLWYVTLFGGASFPNDVKTHADYYNNDFSMDFDTGFVIGGVVGKRINDMFRVEGELSYARYKANTYDEGIFHGYPADGDLSATYLLANVWADVARFGDAKLYVGGGIGAAYVTPTQLGVVTPMDTDLAAGVSPASWEPASPTRWRRISTSISATGSRPFQASTSIPRAKAMLYSRTAS
jgi:opacity protein-like surface antigen